MNYYLETILKRHEKRKELLRPHGFPIADKPTDFLVAQSEAAYDLARFAKRFHRPDTKKLVGPSDRDLLRYIKEHPLPTDEEVIGVLRGVPQHWAPNLSYLVFNAAQATTAAPVKQPTGNAIRTMMQLKAATGYFGRIIEWGCSFDASAAATPGQCELIETGTVGATALSTAYVAGDIQPFEDPNSPANTAGTSGVPFNLGTSASGFATAAVTEGTTTASRMLDIQMLPPTGPYIKQMPLGREPSYGYYAAAAAAAQNYLRVRMTFGATVNATIYIITEF